MEKVEIYLVDKDLYVKYKDTEYGLASVDVLKDLWFSDYPLFIGPPITSCVVQLLRDEYWNKEQ